jgi:hypothetical protein
LIFASRLSAAIRYIPVRLQMPVAGLGIWLLASVLLIISTRAVISGRTGWDPDDQLRLVQLRDFLGGQGWFDTTQYRLNSPDGAPMHWSRLIELPLALLVTIFAPIIGTARAEMLAGTAVPLACLAAIAFMASAIATRFAGKFAGIVALILVFMTPAVLIQTRPMRIDHHGWQIVMAMLGLWSLYWPSRKWGGVTLGLALATWLHISLEGAPMTAAFFLLLGWRWIFGRSDGLRLFWALAAFALVSVTLFFGTSSVGLMARNFCDTVSPMHIGAIVLGSAILLPALHSHTLQHRWRLLAAVVAGAVVVACLLLAAPICAQGAFAGLDPLVREYWYGNVSEGLPIWHQDQEAAWTLIAGPLAGLAALLALRKHYRGLPFGTLAFLLLYATILSFFVFRTVSVAAAFAAIPVALWIAQLFARWRTCEIPVRRILLIMLMLSLAVPGAIAGPLVRKLTSATVDNVTGRRETHSEKCESVASVKKLSLLPDSSIIAPFDMGPAILLNTRHRVLASSHHRNEAGMRDQILIFRSTPEKAKALMLKRGITHIAVCPDEAELGLYAKKDPNGLWAALANAKVPDWLENEGVYGDGIMVWHVKDAGNP